MATINVNGKYFDGHAPAIRIDDHAYRYGNGLFETMKMENGQIRLAPLHFERLFSGMKTLNYTIQPTQSAGFFREQILELAEMNHCRESARIRLTVSAGHGGLYENDGEPSYSIECSPLELGKSGGWKLDVFTGAKKNCDAFSQLKSTSHLVYAAGARHAKLAGLDDCLILNTHERITDSTIANVFWISQGSIFTPPLNEGCIAGVMRRFIMDQMNSFHLDILEKECTVSDLETADEIFLTNAVRGILPVEKFRDKIYGSTHTMEVSRKIF